MVALAAADDGKNWANRFVEISDHLVSLFKNESLNIRPYLPGTPHFSKLSDERKKEVVGHLEFYRNLCVSQLAAGDLLRNSKRLTWRALTALRLVPPSGVLDQIFTDCVIEIYTPEHFQIFRSLEFFDLSNYSLEELFCMEWWLLFKRREEDFAFTMAIAEGIFSGKYPSGINPRHQPYVIVEEQTPDKNSIHYELVHCAPLYRNHQVEAVLCIERAHVLNKTSC